MRRTIVGAVLTATVTAGGLVTASPAHAAQCVSRHEWRVIDANSPRNHFKAQVHAVFDFNGRRVFMSNGIETRRYRRCDSSLTYRHVTYRFRDGWAGRTWYAVDKFSA
jgi:hypothetical protein